MLLLNFSSSRLLLPWCWCAAWNKNKGRMVITASCCYFLVVLVLVFRTVSSWTSLVPVRLPSATITAGKILHWSSRSRWVHQSIPLGRLKAPLSPRFSRPSTQSFTTIMSNSIAKDLPPLILGSASFTRKLILKEMGLDYTIVVRPIDERSIATTLRQSSDTAAELVLTLAQAKMKHLVAEISQGNYKESELPGSSNGEYLVMTADQVVTCNGSILEKPDSVEQAKEFVSLYGKHAPSTTGSVIFQHIPSGIQVSGVDTATIVFSPEVGPDLVDRLLNDDQGKIILSCAGGLMVEHPMVQEYVERIDGTQDSVMGLSKDLVTDLLKEMQQKLKEHNA